LENNCMRYVCRPGKNARDKLLPPDDREEESGRRPGTLYPMLNVAE
jgi:hypothetical protein